MEELRNRTQGTTETILSYVTGLRIIFDKMSPCPDLSRQLDKACQNLNPTYAVQINRKDVSTFEDLLDLGKQVEIKMLNMQNYKEPPLPESSLLANAAWHRPKEDKPAKKQGGKKNSPKNEVASVDAEIEVASVKEISKEKQKSPQKPIDNPKNSKKFSTAKSDFSQQATPTDNKANEQEHGEMPRPGECFKCRRTGHNWTKCTFRKLFKTFCYGCGRANLIRPRCPTCKNSDQENREGGQFN